MTFSVLGADGTAVGMAVSSSSTAVAARCIHLRQGVGGSASQNLTDPRLGVKLLDALAEGLSPEQAIDRVTRDTPDLGHRQLTVINMQGESAMFSGTHALGIVNERRGRSVVSAGNILADPAVIDRSVEAFETSTGELELRLMAALEAGLAAGGEAGPLRSAGLAVMRNAPWPETDLRVDWSEEPISELRRLLELWLPERQDYLSRALRPDSAPHYEIPGSVAP
ncbi:putative Ntn-hydrolase superfamily protein [Psychromicrobium silvestre]|uniref:Putative Ntn-hydrolase superfamily protein n=1 Tax=Psychromicrobium silvestre TaxID=1645614 RepID=A0A7Y9LT49_9MICC|nr:putative Ntn-hydrolase superfamily protein [Psychromicrobium silvestre]